MLWQARKSLFLTISLLLYYFSVRNCSVSACNGLVRARNGSLHALKWFGTCLNGLVRARLILVKKRWFGTCKRCPLVMSWCPWGHFFYKKYPHPRAPFWRLGNYGKYHTKFVRSAYEVRWRSLYKNIVQDWFFVVIGIFFQLFFSPPLKSVAPDNSMRWTYPSP